MAEITLLFGIGATKAGTSWLHEWLSGHPEVHLWPHKELHYFDAIDDGRVMQQIDQVCERRATLRARMKTTTMPEKLDRLRHRVAEIDRYLGLIGPGRLDVPAYLRFLTENRGAAHVVGDITPAYALLSVERLQFMAGLARNTKFVYLMRDPVERLWSNVRAMAARGDGDLAQTAKAAQLIFDRWVAGQERALAARCDYGGALRRLRAAVPESDRFVGFYEEVFAPGAAETICGFLGIAPLEAPVARPVNAGPQVALDAGRRAIAADLLAPQYDEVKSLLGRVPGSWQPMGVEVR